MSLLEPFAIQTWTGSFTEEEQARAVLALESGRVLYFPQLPFPLSSEEESSLLNEKILDAKSKNVSYLLTKDMLKGALVYQDLLKGMLRRYAQQTKWLLLQLLPCYSTHVVQGKTSFRPVEIAERKPASYRKDDTRLHVDAFPSQPMQGKRILRFFTNINNEGKPRVWNLGEPLESVLKRFLPKSSRPVWGSSNVLKWLGITKEKRSLYDHYMLQIHDRMKKDLRYQTSVQKEQVCFPPGCSWAVFTDQVSHAALEGQHVLEQTFYLPVLGLHDQASSPLRLIEQIRH